MSNTLLQKDSLKDYVVKNLEKNFKISGKKLKIMWIFKEIMSQGKLSIIFRT